MQNSYISQAVEKNIGWVTIDRPEARNALSTEMWRALPVVLNDLQSAGARAVVLSGAGGTFAAGADLVELHALHSHAHAEDFWSAIEDCLNFVCEFNLPVIAMIDGACVGGGCLLATACDLRYASSVASFAIPVAKLGIVLDDASIARLVSTVGDSFSRQLLFTGSTVQSDEALMRGLVDGVFSSESLRAQVTHIASSIIRNDVSAVSAVKHSLHRIRVGAWLDSVEHRNLIIESYLSPELRARVGKVLSDLQGHSS